MKVFISGPMFKKEAFFKACHELENHGYSVWNPAWLAYPSNTEFSDKDIHDIDIEALKHCDAIYMIKGWKYSDKAWNEHKIACATGLVIMYEGVHCWGKEPEDEHDVLNRHIKTVEEAVAWERWKNKLPDRLDNHADRIDILEDEVEAIKESIGTDNLQEQLEKDFADVYEEFQNTKDKVNDIEFGYINWSSKMSSAIEEMEKVKDTVSDIRRIVNSSDIKNISVKAMNDRMNLFGRELDSLSTAIDIKGKDIGSIVQKRCDDNRTINNMINDLNIRLKAIEKRLSIKPFYAPTEDEKDD